MAISSNNTFATNKLVTMIAIRAAEAAGYLTVGSKKYFTNQLVGKNNSQDYDFYIRDTGDAVNRLAYQAGDKIALAERKVTLSLDPWHVLINTNAIEKATDIEDWEDEIAKPNGQKLIQGVVRKAIENDLGKVGTAFIGSGFTPLSQAAAHLASVVSEDLYGFVDPNVEAILTSNGQQFVPVDAPDMYSKGLLGRFHGAEYRSQRWLPVLNLTSAASVALNGSVVTNVSANATDSKVWDVVLSGTTLSGNKIPKATPLFIEGVKTCDTVGDPTSMDQAFITLEDVTAAGNTGVIVKVRAKDITKGGTREIAKEDGTSFSAVSAVTGAVSAPEAGKYFTGIVRADGSYEFETMDKIDAAGAEYAKSPAVEGLTVHQNRLVDLRDMTDDTRWDIVTLCGTVEPRSVAMFYVK
jgi:hypothetical protein